MIIDPEHIDQNELILYLLGELSPEEMEKVKAWIQADQENYAVFSSLEKTWIETGKIKPAPVVVNVDQAWTKLKSRIRQEDNFLDFSAQTTHKTRNLGRTLFLVAAAAALIIGAVSIVFSDWFNTSLDPVPVVIESFTEVVTDTLRDGSSVTLNKDSRLTYVESKKVSERQVILEGEAFFNVESDSSKPFVIDAGIGAIKVLGTKFNVRAYEGADLEVLVESGTVQLSLPYSLGGITDSLLLKAGDKGVISHAERRLYKIAGETPDELYWANRKLIFRDTELKKVFEILKQYNEFEVSLEHNEVLECRLTASFTDTELPDIMEVIAVSFELTLESKDSTYTFNGKGCLDEEEL